MTLLLTLVLFIYVLTISHLIYGYGKIKTYYHSKINPKTFFAIIIPFRNEEENLPHLLESLKKLNYPKDLFEIILVDDFSTDDSVKLIYKWRMKNGEFQTTLIENLRISNSPKKDAISRVIPILKNEWIITTDADVVVPENWLLTFDNYIQKNKVSMIAAAVTYSCKPSVLHQFQLLDIMSIQGATIGSFGLNLGFMCSGANFSYTKSFFMELNGFSGNERIASGDDVFLLQKAMRYKPETVHYLKSKDTTVSTKPAESWRDLFQQRLRWASKTSSYSSVFAKDLALIVFSGNIAIAISWILLFIEKIEPLYFGIFLMIKFVFDTILIHKTMRFFTNKRMQFLILSSLIYPFFCITIALCSFLVKYEWKGRTFR